ncbi:biopolymer transporter ExbD [Hydrogenophaga sp. 5NK40-0174]|uniref:ExbD/TolR family protein n=1 Tax=Hydrogenophaga sp. 5NK40-0174 TaxID=3127649 RepID=UPI00310B5F70
MAIGTQEDNDQMLSEINMIPFIDVMLVLLIIFIITVPVIKHAVNVELPEANSQALEPEKENVRLSINADGEYFWNELPVQQAEMAARMSAMAAEMPQPTLHIQGDKAVRYETVATAMSLAQSAGIRQIGFVTEAAPTQP